MILFNIRNHFQIINHCTRYKNFFLFLLIIFPIFIVLIFRPIFYPSIESTLINFSHPNGVYTDPIDLNISTSKENVEIKFTLDGSLPSFDSETYVKPIKITDTSVVRARIFHENRPIGSIFTKTYILGKQTSLPVVTLTTDPEGLWSNETGIYVLGDNRNYNKRGIEWERPSHIQLYEPDGSLGFEMDLGLRIHGGITRSYSQKGFRIIPRTMYGENLIHYPIFPELPYDKYRRLLVRAAGNDAKLALFRDALIQSLASDLNLDTQACRQSILYLNGQYWGIYNIREYYDLRYFKNHYGVKDNSVVVLEPIRTKNGEPRINEGNPGDEKHYQDLINFVSSKDLKIEDNYKYVQTQMDTKNYIDYFSLQIYSGNKDWLDHNIKYWRFKTDKYYPKARYGLDGRWRWLVYDLDEGFMDPNYNGLETFTAKLVNQKEFASVLIRNLLKNDSFKYDFINRQADFLNTIFVPDIVLSKIDTFYEAIKDEIPSHLERWDGSLDNKGRPSIFSSYEEWENNVKDIRDFAIKRTEIVQQQYVDYFKLGGTTNIKILSNIPSAGRVLISSIEVNKFPEELVYFQSVPIPIKAIPNLGYRFSHWETQQSLTGEFTNTDNELVSGTSNVEIKAIFEPTVFEKIYNLIQLKNDRSTNYKLIP